MSQSVYVREPNRDGSTLRTVSNWTRIIAIWFNRRQGRQDLCSLDDRLLQDVGISREDVLWKAGKPF